MDACPESGLEFKPLRLPTIQTPRSESPLVYDGPRRASRPEKGTIKRDNEAMMENLAILLISSLHMNDVGAENIRQKFRDEVSPRVQKMIQELTRPAYVEEQGRQKAATFVEVHSRTQELDKTKALAERVITQTQLVQQEINREAVDWNYGSAREEDSTMTSTRSTRAGADKNKRQAEELLEKSVVDLQHTLPKRRK